MKIANSILVLTAALFAWTPSYGADTYPDRPIRFVVPFTAGSSTDLIARAVGSSITQETGQAVVVENRPGANGFIGASTVARAPADGYTVFITTNTTQAANQWLFKQLPYDPVKDFSPLSGLAKGSLVMVVNSNVSAKDANGFIAAAKADPGKISYAYGTSSSQIASEMLKSMTGIQLTPIPYKSNPPALQDLMGGEVQMMMADIPTALPLIKANKLRALAVSSKTRSRLLPDVPTMDEVGVKGYELTYWFAAYGPANLAPAVQNRLNALIISALRKGSVQQTLQSAGLDPFPTTPAELADFQASETRKWGEIIKAAHIEAQ
ncbi:Bug family tripartite tricarboxylate transporter substrate binding protein [Bordetella genomosp. 11]|uniref:ABC transporter substrate-binding protein n=1 Tax=Bordetella genomosp. 11 TaxID=1416808 RepID=A0A261UIQ3_9BORD|nr:tripartite tricarboxylate transporter substrate binding protein [Bordetella genomosp. 11]OZI61804.1 ABC transporter substrate-binding protein [Bordetella genomosp. 11]